MAAYCANGVLLAVLFITSKVNGGALLQQSKAEEALFPPSPINYPTEIPPPDQSVNATSSFSEKLANFTETGLQKLRSGVTSIINNVSNVFNRSQDSAILGSACTTDTNCSAVSNAACDKGMCNCGINFTVANYVADRCLRVVKLGEGCEEDIQCLKGTVGAVCVSYHCVCSDLYTEEAGRCVPKRKLGSPCTVRDDCAQMPFAECNDAGVCACPKPFISSTYNNACLIMASPAGDPPCQEDKQCVATYGNRTACINNICTCDHDYHPYNGKCLSDLKLGDPCSQPYDCIVSKYTEDANQRECYNGTCTCKPGWNQISDNQCSKGFGYQLQASLAWLLCVFILPYLL